MSLARRVIGSLLVAAAILALAEGLLAALDLPAPGLFAGDPGYHWTLRSELDEPAVPHPERGTTFPVRTGREGLRDELPAAGDWVLATGCSTTFGWGLAAEDAWPARLEQRLALPVVNAGVPGHSSVQGLRQLEELLPRGPRVVVLGWLVRDAQRAAATDLEARPTPWLRRTRLFRALRGLAVPERPAEESWDPGVGTARVPPDAYREQILAAARRVEEAGAVPLVLAFPMQDPPEAHLAALEALPFTVLRPRLPAGAWFEDDPIHLDRAGHELLAAFLEPPVRAALAGP